MYVLVTGALSGIGRETLRHLASKKFNLIACIEHPSDDFNNYASELEGLYGTDIKTISFDLESEESIKSAIKELKSSKLEIFGLVNVAGITKDSTALMTTMSDLRRVNEINFFGQILLTQYFIKLTQSFPFPKSVVFISSISAIDGLSGMLSYGTSKAALINAAKVFSRELATKNYRFNVIAPGVINTQMNELVPDEILSKRISSTSLRRIGEPIEVAKTIEFLISEYSSFITGQVIRVDGGMN
jgi:3-oxoacyl-[acyl-carrier protein] reductase